MNIKKYFKIAALMLAGAFATTGCSHDELDLYSGPEAAIYIQQVNTTDINGNPLSYKEGNTVSFAGASPETVKANTVFYVKMMGKVVDYDRKYTLLVDEENTDAEASDYSLDDNDFTIKAGQSADTVRVTLFRSQKLRSQTVTVSFKIEPNENFNIGIEEYKNSSSWQNDGPMYSATSFYVKFNENYTCPYYWSSFGKSYFGDFSASKYVELNNLMGWTATDWSNAGFSGAKIVLGRFDFSAKTFQKYLQSMADAGTPVLDDDGSYMQLPTNYAVNYSAYE